MRPTNMSSSGGEVDGAGKGVELWVCLHLELNIRNCKTCSFCRPIRTHWISFAHKFLFLCACACVQVTLTRGYVAILRYRILRHCCGAKLPPWQFTVFFIDYLPEWHWDWQMPHVGRNYRRIDVAFRSRSMCIGDHLELYMLVCESLCTL